MEGESKVDAVWFQLVRDLVTHAGPGTNEKPKYLCGECQKVITVNWLAAHALAKHHSYIIVVDSKTMLDLDPFS